MACGVRILFHRPEIPQNTGTTIRVSAITGAEFHLAGPHSFDLSDARLRRAGLDYHERARFTVHEDLEAAYTALLPARVFAFTAHARRSHVEVDWRDGDVLLFGREADGLPPQVLSDDRITDRIRIPMLPENRSLNLATSAAIAVYEAWRQQGFAGAG